MVPCNGKEDFIYHLNRYRRVFRVITTHGACSAWI